ncbi:hypothetical protein AB0I81_39210 [Nonomuraea sp. NPDC050404]|uniref:hypothetical protein n=1 Tax=Nonomuraea sp. NPDC050404 TaxID=3155783 RepID=UPI00340FDFD7
MLVVGGGAAAYAYLSAPGPAPTVALPSTSPSTSSPSESASPPQAPTTAPPQSTPPESTSPTNTQPTSTPAQSGTPITHNEFDDWTFTQGGVKFEADKVAGWTYSSCKGLDSQGVLVKNRCQRAVQLAYSAYGGHLKAVQLVMSFPNDQAAKITADRLATLSSNAVKWRQDKALPSYAYGKILSGSAKRYVVMTIVTADKSARTKAPNFHAYLQTDRATSILSRGQTLTS